MAINVDGLSDWVLLADGIGNQDAYILFAEDGTPIMSESNENIKTD